MNIIDLHQAIHNHTIRITNHADEEANNDNLQLKDIYESVINGEIIETYMKDKPYPSCLVYGHNKKGDPIHSVWAYNNLNGWAVLITVYKPDPQRWLNWKVRM